MNFGIIKNTYAKSLIDSYINESKGGNKKKYKELEIHDDLVFHFIYICVGISAFNIQYRKCGVKHYFIGGFS